jgi:hypothetical protein
MAKKFNSKRIGRIELQASQKLQPTKIIVYSKGLSTQIKIYVCPPPRGWKLREKSMRLEQQRWKPDESPTTPTRNEKRPTGKQETNGGGGD